MSEVKHEKFVTCGIAYRKQTHHFYVGDVRVEVEVSLEEGSYGSHYAKAVVRWQGEPSESDEDDAR